MVDREVVEILGPAGRGDDPVATAGEFDRDGAADASEAPVMSTDVMSVSSFGWCGGAATAHTGCQKNPLGAAGTTASIRVGPGVLNDSFRAAVSASAVSTWLAGTP